MAEQIDPNKHLDQYIEIIDVAQLTPHWEPSHKRFRADLPSDKFPVEAYDALRDHDHFSTNSATNNRAKAADAAAKFKQIMGFSVEDLHNREVELEKAANKNSV